MDLYDVARQITDEVFGEGTYAEMNKGNPDPEVQRAITHPHEVKPLTWKVEPMQICSHCGAVWDDKHEQGHCGVSEATDRILAGWRPIQGPGYACTCGLIEKGLKDHTPDCPRYRP